MEVPEEQMEGLWHNYPTAVIVPWAQFTELERCRLRGAEVWMYNSRDTRAGRAEIADNLVPSRMTTDIR